MVVMRTGVHSAGVMGNQLLTVVAVGAGVGLVVLVIITVCWIARVQKSVYFLSQNSQTLLNVEILRVCCVNKHVVLSYDDMIEVQLVSRIRTRFHIM